MLITYTYLGHGTHLVHTGGHNILINPFLDKNPAAPLKAADVAADFILVNHGHNDHIADAVAIAQRTGAPCCGNAKVAAWLKAQGARPDPIIITSCYVSPSGSYWEGCRRLARRSRWGCHNPACRCGRN